MTSYAEGLEKQNIELQEQLAAAQHDAAIGKELLQFIEYVGLQAELFQKDGCYHVRWGTKNSVSISKDLWKRMEAIEERRKQKQLLEYAALLKLYEDLESKKAKEKEMAAGMAATQVQQALNQLKAFQKLEDDN
jgi:hypothetical protein